MAGPGLGLKSVGLSLGLTSGVVEASVVVGFSVVVLVVVGRRYLGLSGRGGGGGGE